MNVNRPGRARNDRSSAKIVKRIIASVTIGAITYFVTNILIGDIGVPQIWAIVLSVLLGGVVLLTQFLHELDTRVCELEEAQAEHSAAVAQIADDRFTTIKEVVDAGFAKINEVVQSGFTKINEATELFGLVEASALRTDAMTQLVRHSTQLDPTAPSLILRFAQAEIGRMSEFLKELSEGGNVTYEGEDRDWMLGLAKNAEQAIDATSLTTVDARGNGFVDSGLWSSDLGQRYLEVQRDAIIRGVRIRRVFIMDRPTLAQDAAFLDVCKLQRDLGIQVRVLDSSAIPGTRRSSLFDFVLFDDAISYETTPASSLDGSVRPAIVNTRLELRPNRVKDRIQRFKDLWASAREFDDVVEDEPVTR
jgi:hypothetical protein